MKKHTLKSIDYMSNFLKNSDYISLKQFNLKLFLNFLLDNPEISSFLTKLKNKTDNVQIIVDNFNQNSDFPSVRGKLINFNEYVSFCFLSLINFNKSVGLHNLIDQVTKSYTSSQTDPYINNESKKIIFFNSFIEPILIYLRLELDKGLNILNILERYKVLCEWYEREDLKIIRETKITKNHVGKYLFDQGFTYSLYETTMPSGRADNLAFNINKDELHNLPNAIVIESKIFNGNKQDILDVSNQILKRMKELNFNEGYTFIYNKTSMQIEILNTEKIGNILIKTDNNLKIYFLIINLDDEHFKSKSDLKKLEISLN